MITDLYPKRFNEIGMADIALFVTDSITTLSKEMGKRLDESDLEFISGSICRTLLNRYKNWRAIDFVQCLNNGKIGIYHAHGQSSSLTVAVLEGWMFKHASRVQAAIIESSIADAAKMRNQAATAFTDNRCQRPEIPEAVLWRVSQLTALRESYSKVRRGLESPNYISERDRINALTLENIADAIKSGSTNHLLK